MQPIEMYVVLFQISLVCTKLLLFYSIIIILLHKVVLKKGLEVFRDFLAIDALNWSQKLVEFKTHVWQMLDLFWVTFFMLGVILRTTHNFDYGMLMYRVSSIYWNLRFVCT